MALLRTIQREEEEHTLYLIRLSNSITRSGNVHTSYEGTTYFIHGLKESIRTLISHSREAERPSTYLDVVNYAEVDGDAVLSLNNERVKSRNLLPRRVTVPDRRSRKLHPLTIIGESPVHT